MSKSEASPHTPHAEATQREPLPLGVWLGTLGRISAVGCLSGERYYWLTHHNAVTMWPAKVIESMPIKGAQQ